MAHMVHAVLKRSNSSKRSLRQAVEVGAVMKTLATKGAYKYSKSKCLRNVETMIHCPGITALIAQSEAAVELAMLCRKATGMSALHAGFSEKCSAHVDIDSTA
mmetsp:Transcript_11615/g.18903  ORF Transcript_11615/g.18903 Transcript_11615/m.18903 type:complete len:103 (-) Transcript_11615:383-691(-)